MLPAFRSAKRQNPGMEYRFQIAVLCTGNACRSPFAEHCLRRRLDQNQFSVVSASTGLHEGIRSPAGMIDAASSLGVDLSAHRSTPLTRLELASFDLVIGFELQHVAAAIVHAGAPKEKVFTLPDLAISISSNPEGPRAAIRSAYEKRLEGPMQEIADPIGGSVSDYITMTRTVAPLCVTIANALSGRS